MDQSAEPRSEILDVQRGICLSVFVRFIANQLVPSKHGAIKFLGCLWHFALPVLRHNPFEPCCALFAQAFGKEKLTLWLSDLI